LEYRLKQLERSLQNLQRNLHPAAHSDTPRSSNKLAADDPRSIWERESSSYVLPAELGTTAGHFTPLSLEVHEEEPDVEGLEALNLEGHSLVAAVSNISLLQQLFSAHDQLKGILDSLPLEQASPQSTLEQSSPAAENNRSRPSRLELGRTMLRDFPPLPLCHELVRVYFESFHQIRPVVPRHWVGQILKELFQIQGLAEPRTADGIAEAAARIDHVSENRVPGSSSSSLLSWNTVGVLLSMFAIATYTAPQLLDIHLLRFHQETLLADEIRIFAFKMHDLVGVCWELSDPHERADESLVLLLYFYFMLHIVFGEHSKQPGLKIYISTISKQKLHQNLSWRIFTDVSSVRRHH
jgi:hypothetical protein